jgi:hypothetical protein
MPGRAGKHQRPLGAGVRLLDAAGQHLESAPRHTPTE